MNSLSNVIFIAYLPLTKKFEKDFYLIQLEQAGFKIEYWNLAPLFHKDLEIHGQTFSEKVLNITSYKQLEKKIENYRLRSLFVFDITYSGHTYKLFRVFSKYECLTAAFARGALPHPDAKYTLIKRFFLKFRALRDPEYLKKTIWNQLAVTAKKSNVVKPYNFIFYAGRSGVSNIGYGFKYGLDKSKLIAVNSFDYDAYLSIKEKKCREVQPEYCVFLDTYLPFHPDFEMLKLPKVDAVKYFDSMNRFFESIENTYKIKVVIAAHPKSDYETRKCYGERIVIKNKTAELVQHAEFAMAHLSTSISFAVLFKKPLVFVYNNTIKETYPYTQYPQILYFSKILNASCINADEYHSHDLKFLPADEVKCDQYKYNFLTNPESEKYFTESIFTDTLKSMQ